MKAAMIQSPGHMKICYVLKRYPRLSETFIVNEMLELQRQGVDLTIVAKKESGESLVHENVRALRAPIYYLPSISTKDFHLRAHLKYSDASRRIHPQLLAGAMTQEDHGTLMQAAVIAPFLHSLGVTHVHAHFATWAATLASFVGRLAGLPFSITAHAKDIYHESVNAASLTTKLEHAQFVITVSEFNKDYLEKMLAAEQRRGRIIRLYNGIDLEQFPYSPVAEEQEPPLILGVGRLVQKKGFSDLIAACNIVKKRGKPFRCAIIGDGEERSHLEAQIRRHDLHDDVQLLGAKTQNEVVQFMKRSTIFVLPCKIGDDGNRDGLPTALLEAMAIGVPVISTKVTGIPEIITHKKTGLLVEENDQKGLATAMEVLLTSEFLRKEFSRGARLKVQETFDLARNVRTLKEHFLCHQSSVAA